MKNIICGNLALTVIPLYYGSKHIAHVKCVEAALDMHCKRSYQNYQKVESVEVNWWNPINTDGYKCVAKVLLGDSVREITFIAKEATLASIAKDDWEPNFGFWGWIGEDYRIIDIKAK